VKARLSAVLVLLSFLLTAGAAVPLPAGAATSVACGTACDGKDPTTFNVCSIEIGGSQCSTNPDLAIYCADDVPSGTSVQSKTIDDLTTLRLEYSKECHTAWAFVKVTGGAGSEGGPVPVAYVQSWTTGGTLRLTGHETPDDFNWYSYMVSNKSGLKARACYSPIGSYTSATQRVCTAMYTGK
jgi:Protein of unknown function (DUF2690)